MVRVVRSIAVPNLVEVLDQLAEATHRDLYNALGVAQVLLDQLADLFAFGLGQLQRIPAVLVAICSP